MVTENSYLPILIVMTLIQLCETLTDGGLFRQVIWRGLEVAACVAGSDETFRDSRNKMKSVVYYIARLSFNTHVNFSSKEKLGTTF